MSTTVQTNEIVERLRSETARQGARALVALSPENVTYAIGYLVPSHATNRHRRTVSIIAEDGRAALVVVSVEYELAKQQSKIADVRSYDQFSQNPMDLVADVLTEFGITAGPIAIELDYLPAQDYLHLRERLPQLTFEPCRELYLRTRMRKTPPEIATLRRIAEVSDLAEQVAFEQMQAGMTEKQLAAIITEVILANGGDGVRMLIGAGERAGIVNPKPSDRATRPGDVIRVEVLANLNNYQSNVTRTGVLGPPTDEQRRIWQVLIEANNRARAILRPGTEVRQLWQAYADHVRANGLEPTLKFLGHGIGLTGHEEPYITEDKTMQMEPGMVVTFEPFLMFPGRMGFHVEDMYLVTENGYEHLSTVVNNDQLIQVG